MNRYEKGKEGQTAMLWEAYRAHVLLAGFMAVVVIVFLALFFSLLTQENDIDRSKLSSLFNTNNNGTAIVEFITPVGDSVAPAGGGGGDVIVSASPTSTSTSTPTPAPSPPTLVEPDTDTSVTPPFEGPPPDLGIGIVNATISGG
jgi:hypothetical protein